MRGHQVKFAADTLFKSVVNFVKVSLIISRLSKLQTCMHFTVRTPSKRYFIKTIRAEQRMTISYQVLSGRRRVERLKGVP
jgi:hypothetical protein